MMYGKTPEELRKHDQKKILGLLVLLLLLGFSYMSRPKGADLAAGEIPGKFSVRWPPAGGFLEQGDVAFSGMGAPNAMVRILGDGAEMASGTVDKDGKWRINVPIQPPFPKDFKITHQLSGKEPESTLLSGMKYEEVKGTGSDQPFNISRPVDGGTIAVGDWTIAGTGPIGAKVRLDMDKYLLGSVVVDANGTWKLPRKIHAAGEKRVLKATLVEDKMVKDSITHTVMVTP